MSLRTVATNTGKALLVKNDDGYKLATSDACCCSPPPPCSGPCDEENPCPEGCYCCDGQCQPEPCDDCSGPCDEENPCTAGCVCVYGECIQPVPCSNDCAYGLCSITTDFYLLEGSKTARPLNFAEYGSAAFLLVANGVFQFSTGFPFRPGYEFLLQDSNCSVFFQIDEVAKTQEFPDEGLVYQQTWRRNRLFSVNCDSGEMTDISSIVSYGAINEAYCLRGPFGGPSFSVPATECPMANPGYKPGQEPQLICPP